MDSILERASELKQALTDFVLDAEGDLATALETYSADQLARASQSQQKDRKQQDLVVDTFLTAGQVGNKTPLELFAEGESGLSEGDRQLLSNWTRNFTGLFAIQQILPDGFELMNWLTMKTYIVKPNSSAMLEDMARLKVGEIVVTRIAPVEDYWTFFSPYLQLGNLGKPKLAVAIGNFKQNHKSDLYGDAPELLEEAWKSVDRYHQDFLDFFGSDEVTLPGYQLSKKIPEFQEFLTQRRLDEAGIDSSKSLSEMAQEAGMGDEELGDVAESMGLDAQTAAKLLNNKNAVKMAAPQVDIPADLKKAEQVTVLAHPRWGQMFLTTHTQFINLLESDDWQSVKGADKLIRSYLEQSTINAFVWHRLAETYPAQLQKVLREFLQRPDFDVKADLDSLLQSNQKPLEPELPEIASVPIHLHDLFQEALAEVTKSQKPKSDKKGTKGFQRA
ncbi:hypothetical protein [Phormidesmis priestleyi]|uniref:hypothetical protein n=1 Tax=Phormidesmis priestleyi TaxID=268141 RepID=UPI00083B7442|nr:hypothetical protein [Phormidesmis priestleyi]